MIVVAIPPTTRPVTDPNLFNRACRILEDPRNPSTATSSTRVAEAKLSGPERESRWKAMVLKIMVMFQTLYFQNKAKHLLGPQIYANLFQTKIVNIVQESTPIRYLRGQVVGKALPRGEGKKDKAKASVDPTMCQHPEEDMMPRGCRKDALWWTCRKCLSR